MSFSPRSLSAESRRPSTLNPTLTSAFYTQQQQHSNLPITMTSNPIPPNPDDDDPSAFNSKISFDNLEAKVSDAEVNNYISPLPVHSQQRQKQSTKRRQKTSARNNRQTTSSPMPPTENQSAISGHAATSEQRRTHHNKHTRKCRARLNHRYDALRDMLPIPPGTEVRHKVQTLDHAIQAISTLRDTNAHLEIVNALRSPPKVISWVETFVPMAQDMMDALKPLVTLISQTGRWPYAEIWQLINGISTIQMIDYSIQCSQMLEPSLCILGEYTKNECGALQTMNEFVGSVFENRQAIWSNRCVEQCRDTDRARLLSNACIRTGFGVPVPVSGSLSYVIAFFDVHERGKDIVHDSFAKFAAVSVGNSYGASHDGPEMEIETEVEENEDIDEEIEEDDEEDDGTTT